VGIFPQIGVQNDGFALQLRIQFLDDRFHDLAGRAVIGAKFDNDGETVRFVQIEVDCLFDIKGQVRIVGIGKQFVALRVNQNPDDHQDDENGDRNDGFHDAAAFFGSFIFQAFLPPLRTVGNESVAIGYFVRFSAFS
jgi:hypothetical protein